MQDDWRRRGTAPHNFRWTPAQKKHPLADTSGRRCGEVVQAANAVRPSAARKSATEGRSRGSSSGSASRKSLPFSPATSSFSLSSPPFSCAMQRVQGGEGKCEFHTNYENFSASLYLTTSSFGLSSPPPVIEAVHQTSEHVTRPLISRGAASTTAMEAWLARHSWQPFLKSSTRCSHATGGKPKHREVIHRS